MKRELRCKAYLRYVDDFLLFSDDKRQLWTWREAIMERMARLRLTIHERRAQVRPVTEGIPFLGFVVFRHRRRLKQRKGFAYRRRLRALVEKYADGEIMLEQVTASVQGWVNHVSYGDTLALREALLGNVSLSKGVNHERD